VRLREVRLGPFDLVVEHRPDGTIRARSSHPLGDYPARLTERPEHWAERAPERTFLAKRGPDGAWRRLTYAKTLDAVRRIDQALLDRGLCAERALAILWGNDLEHARSRSPPSTSACPTPRSRPPTRWSPKTSASFARSWL
jgi:feruloyl-CoA synthase